MRAPKGTGEVEKGCRARERSGTRKKKRRDLRSGRVTSRDQLRIWRHPIGGILDEWQRPRRASNIVVDTFFAARPLGLCVPVHFTCRHEDTVTTYF